MDDIAVLVPCYNEAKTVEKVVRDWASVLPQAVIYVYDNNSKDGTDVIARKAGAVVRYERHQGKGNVIRRMFREIDAKAYIIIDGDDTYPAANGPEMVDLVLKHGADMVIGDRLSSTYYVENKRPFHNFGNDLVRYFINRLFHTDIKDIMTGYRAFSYKFVKTFPVLSQGFEIETEMTIHAVDKNMQVENVTIDYRDRPAGSVSKLNTYIDGFKVLRTIMHLYRDYRPLDFFCLLAIVFTLLAVGLDIPVALTYLETGQVPRFPTLIVSGFIVVAALLSFFNGMLLSTLNNRDKRQFELKLIETCDSYERKLNREKSVGASGQLKIEESGIEN
ncbi:MAG: glycosyltransferase family 2 protein [bacterium]|nr:glycosyltransferase family 2 protein [bacterium]